MVRRATGGRTIRVPGVAEALTEHLQAFHAKWDCPNNRPGARAELKALSEWRLVVTGETIWRALHDSGESSQFLGDDTLYAITGPDLIETYTDGT